MLYEIKYFFLKDWFEILRLVSTLFNSIIADEKKEFLKSLCFVLIREVLPTVLVAYGALLTEIRLKRYFECSILKTLWKGQSFLLQRRSWIDFRFVWNGSCYCQTGNILDGFHFCVERIIKSLIIEYITIIYMRSNKWFENSD